MRWLTTRSSLVMFTLLCLLMADACGRPEPEGKVGDACRQDVDCPAETVCCASAALIGTDAFPVCVPQNICEAEACGDADVCADGLLCCPAGRHLGETRGDLADAKLCVAAGECSFCSTHDDCPATQTGQPMFCCEDVFGTYCGTVYCKLHEEGGAGGMGGGGAGGGGSVPTSGPVTVLDDGEGFDFVNETLFGASASTVRFVMAGAGMAFYLAETGEAIEEWVDAATTNYRAIGFRMAGALGDNDVIVSGGAAGYAIRTFNDGVGFAAFQELGATGINVTDVVAMPADGTGVAPGFWWVDNTNSAVSTYSALGGTTPRWSTTQLGMAGAIGRAVAFDPGTPDIVLTTEEILFGTGTTIAVDANITSPSGGFRDVVRDGNTCALSDYPMRVVVFACDDPATQAEIAVDGPVGLDIDGNRILASGSLDGSIHDIVWDGAAVTETVHDVSAISPAPAWVKFYPGFARAAFSGSGIYGTVALE